MKCNKCKTIMQPSKALKDIYISGIDSSNPPQIGDTLVKSGKAELVNVAKCPKCGYSVTT